ncbi:LacI family DNA-binding transcriptional regulator [Furfurilactobacillus curtus]|uniref:LacI family transcriptional regulator n=1 Tax=Furfurilactobacillus curtus TaxID=1746200 RepID=A0ABQ5JV87_9LACO
MSVTIKDVAAAAGVSIATVSRVLAHKDRFYSPATAEKIMTVARDLGYQKNSAAVELVTQKSQVLGVIVSSTQTNFADQIIAGIQDTAFARDLSVIILYAGVNDDRLQQKAIQTVIERSVRGILILALELNDANRQLLDQTPIPHVFLSTTSGHEQDAFVASDDFKIGQRATEYLINKGHTRIGLAAVEATSYVGQKRLAGYRNAMANHQLPIESEWIQAGHFTYADGLVAMRQWGPTPPIDAVVAMSDLAAVGVLNQATDFHLNIPNQLAIVSIDGTDLVKWVRPQLTSITQAFYDMGVAGVNLLLNTDTQPPAAQLLPFKLDERASS